MRWAPPSLERSPTGGGREEDRDHDAEIENMREWVTSYRVVGSKRSAVIVRQVVHVSKGPAKGGSTAYVSLYSAGELRGRELVKAAGEKVPFEVCGASFTSQNHELVLVTKSKAPEEEEERGRSYSHTFPSSWSA